jgi:hypothetical protein
VNVEVDGDGRMASFRQATGFPSRVYLHKPDWYDNEEEALDRVRQMIEAKGKSLAKEQAKLAALKAKVASGSLPTNPWKQATEADE